MFVPPPLRSLIGLVGKTLDLAYGRRAAGSSLPQSKTPLVGKTPLSHQVLNLRGAGAGAYVVLGATHLLSLFPQVGN